MSCEGVNGVIRNTPRHFAGSRGWESRWQGSIRGRARVKSGRSAELVGEPRPTRHAAIQERCRTATLLLPIAPRVRRERPRALWELPIPALSTRGARFCLLALGVRPLMQFLSIRSIEPNNERTF